ncbi:MAG: hypothetical protein NVS2B9_06030 [Myxococcales bacterium]
MVSLSAIPDAGSKFSGWTGACLGTAGCSISMAVDRTVSATFDLLPPPDECNGLHPPDPGAAPYSAFQWFSRAGSQESCRAGYVAGSGTLAFPKDDPTPGIGTTVLFTKPTGEMAGALSGFATDFTEQLDGFVVQRSSTPGGASFLSSLDSVGRERANTSPPSTAGMLEDPTGGVVAVQTTTPPPPVPPAPAAPPSQVLQAFDAQLRLRWSLPLPANATPLRVDRTGNTLVLWDGAPLYGNGSIAAFWVDHGGTQGPVFDLVGPGPVPAATVTAAVRVDSGLFLSTGGLWTLQLDSLATTPGPAPAWLAARPVRDMHMVHNGRGYAILPPNPGDTGPCAQEIEIVAPSGKSCGLSVFRAAGGACRPLGIRVGYDGTVVQQLPSSAEKRCPEGGTQQCTCTWHWWPNFFH